MYFLDDHEWDLFIGVISETDRLHHYLWTALSDEDHPQHEFFLGFYKKIDAFIGELYGKYGDDIPFIILSDHGFTTIKKEVYLNRWLVDRGYLGFKTENPESFADMTGDSRVFALDPARFYIHLEGKYRSGTVKTSEYEGLRRKVKEELKSITVDGEKVIKEVFLKEELYSGSEIDNAPDLVALPYDGFDLKGYINKPHMTGKGLLTGGHTREDAVFFINRKISGNDVNIIDVGPTITALLGIMEADFDGRILLNSQ
jgi:predicted AlkP superfamily phosphohydrolase/phosphomutase